MEQFDECLNQEIREQVRKSLEQVMKNYSYGSVNDNRELGELVSIILDNIIEKKVISSNLDHILEKSVLNHVMNVTVLSAILSIKAGLGKKDIEDITMGCLLHDIGKLILFEKYPELAEMEHTYSTKEHQLMQLHPILGFNSIARNKEIPIAVKKIVLLHHVWEVPEKSFDESKGIFDSYPIMFEGRKIRGEDKNLKVQIVQAVDAFESMINQHRGYRQSNSKAEALNHIASMVNTKFGESALLLKKFISPYSIGSHVQLSNGEIGVVEQQTCVADRPIVKLLSGLNNLTLIDLSKEYQNTTISREI